MAETTRPTPTRPTESRPPNRPAGPTTPTAPRPSNPSKLARAVRDVWTLPTGRLAVMAIAIALVGFTLHYWDAMPAVAALALPTSPRVCAPRLVMARGLLAGSEGRHCRARTRV